MKIGIIGFGVQGKIRFNAIKELNSSYDISIVAESKEYDKDVPMQTKFVRDFNEIVENKSIDIVFITTPNFLNKDLVVRCLDRGKHVFCEKPPGRDLKELEEMIEAAKRNPKQKLMFGFNHRHHDSVLEAKKLIDSKELGKILWMRGRYGKSVDKDFMNTWRAKKELAGGGIFLDQGIHMLDLFLMMAGDFDEVKADVSNLFWKLDVEDNVFAIFKNKQGQVASLHSTMTQWRHLFSFEVFLEKGHIVINGLLTTSGSYGKEELSCQRNKLSGPSVLWKDEKKVVYDINTSWKNEIKLFFDCIEKDKKIPMGNSSDAHKLMKLVDKVYENGRSDK